MTPSIHASPVTTKKESRMSKQDSNGNKNGTSQNFAFAQNNISRQTSFDNKDPIEFSPSFDSKPEIQMPPTNASLFLQALEEEE